MLRYTMIQEQREHYPDKSIILAPKRNSRRSNSNRNMNKISSFILTTVNYYKHPEPWFDSTDAER